MHIDVISDIICPWCYIGKRRLERAIALRPEMTFEIRWRPFQLDPAMPREGKDRTEHLISKFGSLERLKPVQATLEQTGQELGIAFAFDRITRTPNTLDAHRLIRWSHSLGLQDQIVEGLFHAYFVEGLDVGNIDVLAGIGDRHGMDGELVHELLTSDADIESVTQQDTMARKFGVQGVPSFLIGGRTLVTGAEDAEVLAAMIDRVVADNESAVANG